ncbi:MAG: ABC transporter substrate-binding protein [Candidatus Tectomicrobia bacterium]|nr:ABC transporter substrate-binding protein [Candidatus Tectomicrobia bacterium]
MRVLSRWFALAAWLAAAAWGFAGLPLPEAHAAPGGEQVLRVRADDDLITMDPAYVGKPSDHMLAMNIYSGLVRLKAGTLEAEPDLATQWELSPDGRTYTFHLRRGAKWHKGYGEVTAKDVRFSLERIKDPKTKSRFRGVLQSLEKIEVVDDYTIRLVIKDPYPAFLVSVLAFRPGWIVSEKAVKETGAKFGQDPIGSGPFMFEKWVRGSEIVLARNPDAWEKVRLAKVVHKVIRKDAVAKLAIERGDLDVATLLEGASIQEVKKNQKLNVLATPGYATHFMQFNLRRKPFDDVRVRRAFLHATDKEAIAKHVFFGNATARHNLLNPHVFGYEKLERNFYDPGKAKKLLAEAGHAGGLDVNVNVMPAAQWPQVAAVLQEQWKKVGIRAKMNVPERAIYDSRTRAGQFDIAFIRITRSNADQYLYEYFFSKSQPYPNSSGYARADDLLLKGRHTVDDAQRKGFIQAAARKIFVEDVVGFAIVNVNYVVAMQPYVKDNVPTFQDSFPWRQVWVQK